MGKWFAFLTKAYVGAVGRKLQGLDIDRYFYVLLLIDQRDGKICSKDLIPLLRTDKAQLTRVLNYLLESGMIQKEHHPADRRAYWLQLTKSGKQIIPNIQGAFQEVNEALLKDFSEKESELYIQFLKKSMDNLSELPSVMMTMELKQKKNKGKKRADS